jgi:hypothetical protein
MIHFGLSCLQGIGGIEIYVQDIRVIIRREYPLGRLIVPDASKSNEFLLN